LVRARTILLAAALVLVPLGARSADLVVWWEEGRYPEEDAAVREIVTAFEKKISKEVELVFHPQAESKWVQDKAEAALKAGHPPGFAFGQRIDDHLARWAYEGRLVDLSDAVGPLVHQFDPDAVAASTLLDATTGRRGLFGLPMARSTNHVHIRKDLLEQAGFTLADIPREWEAFWSFWCDKVHTTARLRGFGHTGRTPPAIMASELSLGPQEWEGYQLSGPMG
jgi:multiple sugar transport system substrate-binding protein